MKLVLAYFFIKHNFDRTLQNKNYNLFLSNILKLSNVIFKSGFVFTSNHKWKVIKKYDKQHRLNLKSSRYFFG